MYHKLKGTGCFRMTIFKNYHNLHAWCEQNKVYMKFSIEARDKN